MSSTASTLRAVRRSLLRRLPVASREVDLFPPYVPGRYVNLPGRGHTYIRELAGPPGAPTLVLLHGWTATGWVNWATALEPLAKHFHVIAMDERGHGRGIRPKDRFRLTDCADDVAALLDQLGIDRAVLAGYSMGGPIAQLTAHRHPEKVRGLVLCATAGRFPNSKPVDLPLRAAELPVSLVPRRFRNLPPLPEMIGDLPVLNALEDIRRSDPLSLLQAGDELTRYNSTPWLRTLNVPTVVVETLDDHLVPLAEQRELVIRIPHATRKVVDANHISAPLGAGAFVQTLVDACRNVDERARRREQRAMRSAARIAEAPGRAVA